MTLFNLLVSGTYSYVIASIFFMVLFGAFVIFNRNEKTPTNTALINTIWLAVVTSIIEITAVASMKDPFSPPLWTTILYTINLFMMVVCAMYLEVYTFSYLARKAEKKPIYALINRVFLAVFALILILNLKFHFLFEFTTEGHTTTTLEFVVAYMIPLGYLVLGMIGIITRRKILSRREFAALLSIHFLIIAGAMVEAVTDNELLMVSFAMTMSLYIIYTLLEAPDYRQLLETNKMLAEAEEKANEANKAKSDFLSSMSHEIRTPMNAVLGMNEMTLITLEDESLSDEEKIKKITEHANHIQNSGDALLHIINDILDLSKIESGKMDVVEAPYRIKNMLDEVFEMFKYQASKKGLYFKTEVNGQLPGYVMGDVVRVRQVLTNIISNAVKYTKNGGVVVYVNGKIEDDTVIYEIKVEDTGIGIKQENLDKLFETFTRLDHENTHYIEGTGLGLNIVKRLLDLMDGILKIKSEYGKGSVFTVYIPQKILSEETIFSSAQTQGNTKVSRKKFTIKGIRILVVDDNEVNLFVAENFLNQMKATVDTATSGLMALEKIAIKHYDLIFMDHMMPVMNGDEVIKKIKEDPGRYGINDGTPIIALTANVSGGLRDKYIDEYGFDDYLSKPFKFADIAEVISKYVEEIPE